MARIHPEIADTYKYKKPRMPYLNYLSLALSIIALLKAFNVIKW